MKNTRKHLLPLLKTLYMVMKKYSKLYCYPAQTTFLKLLFKYHNIKISRSQLNVWLNDIEEKGYIVRRRRIRYDGKLGIVFQSTMYKILKKGFMVLHNFGVNVLFEIKKIAEEGIKKGFDVFRKITERESIRDVIERCRQFEAKQNGTTVQTE